MKANQSMEIVYLLLAVLLVLLNGFFVLAEFAAVKMRPSRVRELLDSEVSGAVAARHVQDHLDEYLSVCQVGITFTSIGLGFVAEPAVVRFIEPVVKFTGLFAANSEAGFLTTHGVAFALSYMLVSYAHILLGELIPKSIAIRRTDRSALLTSPPLRVFRTMFILPLWVLNGSANYVLGLMGLGKSKQHDSHSEDELRILLNQSQSTGLMTFRRLLFLENVFDLGELLVRDAMRPRSQVRCMNTSNSWDENLQIARRYRFSRYPLFIGSESVPTGIVHLKDLFLAGGAEKNLTELLRPVITVEETTLLESVLAEMQKRRVHAALVVDARGAWSGFLTLEDVIEEIVGTIRDEFEDEEPVHLADALLEDRIHLHVEADSTIEAVRIALSQMKPESLPIPREEVIRAIEERERLIETYLGRHLGMPHARLQGLQKAIVLVIRSEKGSPYRGTTERAHLLFVLLTPTGQPRVHQRLQAVIATLLDESEFIPERLQTATTAAEVLDILRTGEQATLD
jgi:CBS domain containing-hemolysin-like protein